LPNSQSVGLGGKDGVELRGFELITEPVVKPGQTVTTRLFWLPRAKQTKDYTVFLQLLDQNGVLVAGRDSQPLSGYFPTSQWPAGEIVTDLIGFELPEKLPAGQYQLITGMYALDTLERLPVSNEAGDHLVLTTVVVQ
jgi:hypothetical protein